MVNVKTRARLLTGFIVVLVVYLVARSDRHRTASFGLDCTAPPPAVEGLQATVGDGGAELRWQLAPDPQVFTSYTVEGGGASGAKDRFVLPLGGGVDRTMLPLVKGAWICPGDRAELLRHESTIRRVANRRAVAVACRSAQATDGSGQQRERDADVRDDQYIERQHEPVAVHVWHEGRDSREVRGGHECRQPGDQRNGTDREAVAPAKKAQHGAAPHQNEERRPSRARNVRTEEAQRVETFPHEIGRERRGLMQRPLEDAPRAIVGIEPAKEHVRIVGMLGRARRWRVAQEQDDRAARRDRHELPRGDPVAKRRQADHRNQCHPGDNDDAGSKA